jgi:long-chain acyl-CoA synthetase
VSQPTAAPELPVLGSVPVHSARGGYNVYPAEIEDVIHDHPAVSEAAVVGVPDDRLGEEVKALVTLRPGETLTGPELIAYCKERIAAYKYPRIVEFRPDLPKNAMGKVLKDQLVALGTAQQ